jgi:hypothetical protein
MELILGPYQSQDRAASAGIKKEEKLPQFFAHALNGAYSRPITKPRLSCIHWLQN